MQHASSSARGAGRANRSTVHGRTERTLLFNVCISKRHLRRDKERLTRQQRFALLMPPRRGDGRNLSVDAVGRPERGPMGLAHHLRPPRRVPTGLAHLLSSTGGPEAAGAGLIQRTGQAESESGGREHTHGEDTPKNSLYSESAPSARKGGGSRASNASRCSCRQGVRRPGFVRIRGRAPRERPQGLGPRCSASSAHPH